METLSERLKFAMNLRGIRSNQLERLTQLPTGEVSRICTGDRKRPNVEYLDRLSTALRVDFYWLALGRGETPREDNAGGPNARPGRKMAATWVEFDERYPNRGIAVGIAKRDGFSVKAIDAIRTVRLQSDEDMSVKHWLDSIESKHDELARFAPAAGGGGSGAMRKEGRGEEAAPASVEDGAVSRRKKRVAAKAE